MVIQIKDEETGELTGEIMLEPEEYKAVLDLVDPERKHSHRKGELEVL